MRLILSIKLISLQRERVNEGEGLQRSIEGQKEEKESEVWKERPRQMSVS